MSQFKKFQDEYIRMPKGEALTKDYLQTPLVSLIGPLNIAHLTNHIFGFNYKTAKWERVNAVYMRDLVSRYSFLYLRNFYQRRQASIFFFDNNSHAYQPLMTVIQKPRRGDTNKITLNLNKHSKDKLVSMSLQNDLWIREVDKILDYNAAIGERVIPGIEDTFAVFTQLLETDSQLGSSLIKIIDHFCKAKKPTSQIFYSSFFHSFNYEWDLGKIVATEPLTGLNLELRVSNPNVGKIDLPKSIDVNSLVNEISFIREKIISATDDFITSIINRVVHAANMPINSVLVLSDIKMSHTLTPTKEMESICLNIKYIHLITNQEITLELRKDAN